MSDYVANLQKAIYEMYGVDALHLQAHTVKLTHQSQVMWEGFVEEFALLNHPAAKTAYAFGYTKTDGKADLVAILKISPVISPETAVKAFLVKRAKWA